MLRVPRAHDSAHALADDNAAVGADALAGGTNFHKRLSGRGSGRSSGGCSRWRRREWRDRSSWEEAVDDPPLLQVIRRHFHFHAISGENAHAMHAHASRKMTQKFMIFGFFTRDPDTERGIGKGFFHNAEEFYDVFGHEG